MKHDPIDSAMDPLVMSNQLAGAIEKKIAECEATMMDDTPTYSRCGSMYFRDSVAIDPLDEMTRLCSQRNEAVEVARDCWTYLLTHDKGEVQRVKQSPWLLE